MAAKCKGALPDGWTEHRNDKGIAYFINTQSSHRQYEDPRLGWGELPDGWEQEMDEEGQVYFYNHATETSTYEEPLILFLVLIRIIIVTLNT